MGRDNVKCYKEKENKIRRVVRTDRFYFRWEEGNLRHRSFDIWLKSLKRHRSKSGRSVRKMGKGKQRLWDRRGFGELQENSSRPRVETKPGKEKRWKIRSKSSQKHGSEEQFYIFYVFKFRVRVRITLTTEFHPPYRLL